MNGLYICVLRAVCEHTQGDKTCRSGNQSLFHRTPLFLHACSHLHSRPTYSLSQGKGGERQQEAEEGREREDITNFFGTAVCFSDANTAFSC